MYVQKLYIGNLDLTIHLITRGYISTNKLSAKLLKRLQKHAVLWAACFLLRGGLLYGGSATKPLRAALGLGDAICGCGPNTAEHLADQVFLALNR